MNRYWALINLLLAGSVACIVYYLQREGLLLFLQRKEMIAENYEGRKIIQSGGSLLFLPVFLASLPFFLLKPSPTETVFMMMLPVLTFTGLVDDILGDDGVKGLKGHFRAAWKGNLSTGLLKSTLGGFVGIILAWTRFRSFPVMIVDVFLFAFSMNAINLLDLRPGRASKGFGVLLFLIALAAGFTELHFIIPVVTVLVLYLSGELKEQYMLGDTGANLLGGILGFYGVVVLQPIAKGFLFVSLLTFQFFAEFYSLSGFIEQVPWLKRLDMLGRRQKRS